MTTPPNTSLDSSHAATFIIAEAGVNHNGDLALAEKLVDAAADAGADAVKFQTFKAAKLVTHAAKKAEYQIANTKEEGTQFEMLKALELSEAHHHHLHRYAGTRGIMFLSSPFDIESMGLLASLHMKIGKIPSGELTNLRFLQAMTRHFEELILSTGMASLAEIQTALEVLTDAGARRERITVLHCNTEYPTPMEDVNLRAMQTIRDATGCRVGYSDHSLGIEVPIAAVALGAVTIEKHITLDRELPGPDHRCSLEPDQLTQMVRGIRNIEQAMGNGVKVPSPSETKNIEIARRSLHAATALEAGHILREEDILARRPATGISPMMLEQILGKPITRAVPAHEPLTLDHIEAIPSEAP
ncbi:MAG: N-acetylneuraminate synthase [Nannocystaceae bacterium]